MLYLAEPWVESGVRVRLPVHFLRGTPKFPSYSSGCMGAASTYVEKLAFDVFVV